MLTQNHFRLLLGNMMMSYNTVYRLQTVYSMDVASIGVPSICFVNLGHTMF